MLPQLLEHQLLLEVALSGASDKEARASTLVSLAPAVSLALQHSLSLRAASAETAEALADMEVPAPQHSSLPAASVVRVSRPSPAEVRSRLSK